MSLNGFKSILKGVGKTVDVGLSTSGKVAKAMSGPTKNIANSATEFAFGAGGVGLDVAKKVKKIAFEEMTDADRLASINPLEHLLGVKAKTSTNIAAFTALSLYGGFQMADDAVKSNDIGTVVGADGIANTLEYTPNDATVYALENYKNDSYDMDYKMDKKYGSVGADIVFAMHDLRNRM